MNLPFSTTVKWNRFYYISFSIFLLALIATPFSPIASTILWIFLIAYWTAIPGFINIHLIEVDMYEMFFVIIAITFGGPIAAFLAVMYNILIGVVSIQFQPKEIIRYSVSEVITLGLIIPFVHNYFGFGLLTTVYIFTISSYSIFLLQTIFFMPSQIFDTIKFLMISLPIAFLTNTLYVQLIGNPTLVFFSEGMQLSMTIPIIISAFLVAATGIKLLAWYSKRLETKNRQARKPLHNYPPKPPATNSVVKL